MHCSENAKTVMNSPSLGFHRLSITRRSESDMYFEIFGALGGILARALSRIHPEDLLMRVCAVFVLHGAIPDDKSVCKIFGLLLISCINSRSCTVFFEDDDAFVGSTFLRIQRPVDVARTVPVDPSIISPER